MPTFHHWKTGNKKFGLTFQTAAGNQSINHIDRLVKLVNGTILFVQSTYIKFQLGWSTHRNIK